MNEWADRRTRIRILVLGISSILVTAVTRAQSFLLDIPNRCLLKYLASFGDQVSQELRLQNKVLSGRYSLHPHPSSVLHRWLGGGPWLERVVTRVHCLFVVWYDVSEIAYPSLLWVIRDCFQLGMTYFSSPIPLVVEWSELLVWRDWARMSRYYRPRSRDDMLEPNQHWTPQSTLPVV